MTTTVHTHIFVYGPPDGNLTLVGVCACGETKEALAVLPELGVTGFNSAGSRYYRSKMRGQQKSVAARKANKAKREVV